MYDAYRTAKLWVGLGISLDVLAPRLLEGGVGVGIDPWSSPRSLAGAPHFSLPSSTSLGPASH